MQIDTKISILFISIAIILVMILIYDKNAKILYQLEKLQNTIQPIADDYEKQTIIEQYKRSNEKQSSIISKNNDLKDLKEAMQQQFEKLKKKQSTLESQLSQASTQSQAKKLSAIVTQTDQKSSKQQPTQIEQPSTKLKILNNATLMGVVTYVNMDFNLINLELKKPKYVNSGDVLTIRRKGNVAGKIKIVTVDGNRASAEIVPNSLKTPIHIGDELIFY